MKRSSCPFTRTLGLMRSLAWLGLGLCGGGTLGAAEVEPGPGGEIPPDPAKVSSDGERFLFIVETSNESRRFEEANRQAVFDFVVGGVNDQMRSGDTFGIWTYNDQVRSGEFPMTVWESADSLEIAGQAAGFLQKQKYSKEPNLKAVVGELRQLAERVGDFNVFIISTGRERVQGTPFDQNINNAYEAYAKRPSKLARKPLVTGFVVRKGRPIRASVVLAGDRVTLPARPPAVAKAKVPVTSPVKSPGLTNQPVHASTAGIAAPSAAVSNDAGTSPVSRKKVIQITTRSNGASAPIAPATVSATATGDGTAGLSGGGAIGVMPITGAMVATTPSSSRSALAPTGASLVADPSVASGNETGFAVTTVAGILQAAAEAVAPTPLIVAAREPATTKMAAAATSAPMSSSETKPQASWRSPGSDALVIPAAVTLVPSPGLSPGLMLAIGATLLGAVGFLLILVLRRMPRPERGSLISQSMQRD
jgi:hypothetical protein